MVSSTTPKFDARCPPLLLIFSIRNSRISDDNSMSISENVGGMSKYLAGLRTADFYTGLKKGVTTALHKVPFVGDSMIQKMRKTQKNA